MGKVELRGQGERGEEGSLSKVVREVRRGCRGLMEKFPQLVLRAEIRTKAP